MERGPEAAGKLANSSGNGEAVSGRGLRDY
jgi:hypothetical protein